jgi:hypothetical protein
MFKTEALKMGKYLILIRMRFFLILFITISFVNQLYAGRVCVSCETNLLICGLIEKSKSLTYTYVLDDKTPVEIENHFGNVKVRLWDKNEIRVNVIITANAPTTEKAEEFLKIVHIETNNQSGKALFKTKMNCKSNSYKNNINPDDDENPNFLRVDYNVYMPAGHDLNLNNSHGDLYIPEFKDRLVINQKYGALYADHLANPTSTIDVNFGKAFIKSMAGGVLKANQTTLLIDKVDNVTMQNTCGRIQVLEAKGMNLQVSYTKGFVKLVNEDCRFQVKYSKEFKLGEIGESAGQVEIESSHTNLELPLCKKGKFDVLADTRNTEVKVADESGVTHLVNPSGEGKRMLIGTSDPSVATKVQLTSNYGKVELK